jgi:thiol:disulfide interchange protein DsbA
MDCQRIDAILDEHGIDALNGAERAELDEHLERCQRCADAWLGNAMLAADVPDAPRPGLYDEIVTAVIEQPPQAAGQLPGIRWGSRLGMAASAIAIAGLVGMFAFGDRRGARDIDGADIAVTGPGAIPGLAAPVFAPPAEAIGEFMAGRDYERVRNPSPQMTGSSRIEVAEFFMFECIYCFNFEPSLIAWEKTLADNVSVERVPALFNPLARMHAQAFYTAEVLGTSQDLQMVFYQQVHERGNQLDTLLAIREFFLRNGVESEAFDEAFASQDVALRMQRADELSTLYGVTATPSLGVNGRYLTNPGMTGSNERMLAVADAIIAAESRQLCDAGGRSSCPLD